LKSLLTDVVDAPRYTDLLCSLVWACNGTALSVYVCQVPVCAIVGRRSVSVSAKFDARFCVQTPPIKTVAVMLTFSLFVTAFVPRSGLVVKGFSAILKVNALPVAYLLAKDPDAYIQNVTVFEKQVVFR